LPKCISGRPCARKGCLSRLKLSGGDKSFFAAPYA
jgi:hypothetical protein